MSPVRVQRRREKGWRMPENTVYVGRPTHWGNDWRIGDVCNRTTHGNPLIFPDIYHAEPIVLDAETATAHYRRAWAIPQRHLIEADLYGYNLACWCPLDQPCHADVLLEMANR